jgi:putative NADH-flavin reductase
MKVIVFGATGATGKVLVSQARAHGHDVTAMARHPEAITPGDGVKVLRGDARDSASVKAAIAGQDAVLGALGSRSLGKSDLLQRSSGNIIAAMNENGVRRLIILGAAGALHDPSKHQGVFGRTVMRVLLRTLLKNVSRDQAAQERQVEASGLDYTIVRPPFLTNGAATGRYRVALDGLPARWSAISRADVAAFMVEQLDAATHVRAGPYLAT